MSKLDLEMAEEQEIKLPTFIGSLKKQESSRKISSSALLTMLNFGCVDHNKLWKYQTTLPASWEISMQDKKQQLELDIEQRGGFRLGKEYVKALCCHPADLTYMQSTSWEMLDWMKHTLESSKRDTDV